MRIEERAASAARGTILMHNVADDNGRRIVKKGTLLADEEIGRLGEAGHRTIRVAVLEAGDIHEDEAATVLAEALRTPELELTPPAGGRVNLRSRVDGVLQVDAERLLALNMIPGLALATRGQHAVVGPGQESDNVATLKVVPFALGSAAVAWAREVAEPRPGILEIRPFRPGRRVAVLLIGAAAVQDKLADAYVPPTLARLERLGAELTTVQAVTEEPESLSATAARLAESHNLLIIAGQTSIVHEDDSTLQALRMAGAQTTLSGAPVEPGNLLALAYFPRTPVLCAPGCARGLRRNVVDLVLPRLLLGDRLERQDIAALGLGGFLTAAERTGDTT